MNIFFLKIRFFFFLKLVTLQRHNKPRALRVSGPDILITAIADTLSGVERAKIVFFISINYS